ncbi:hypothetical protein AYK24_06775 [Thermoplasmatales archaeon SG8-52-4]|nr:MAG: hypothetical protein AYK24_06775 [Thermoplasmatales archaeon SG8-52-4]
MGMNRVKKLFTVIVIFLFFGIVFFPSSGIQIDNKPIIQSSRGNTLYVGGSGPNNYTKIQDAIDDASDGDTVFVYDDSSPYYENIEIDKSINLVGENKNTTILYGVGNYYYHIDVFTDWIKISRFTIQNGRTGINLRSNYNLITDNIIIFHSNYGINLKGSNNTITKNTLSENNFSAIYLHYSSNNVIKENIISNGFHGIYLVNSNNNVIMDNNFSKNKGGLDLHSYNYNNVITSNSFFKNDRGICITDSMRNTIIYNNLSKNKYSIELRRSCINTISYNNVNSSEHDGIAILDNSDCNTINFNSVNNSTWVGLFFSDSKKNILNNNRIILNKHGIFINGNKNTISGNLIYSYERIGILVSGCSNIIISNNICSDEGDGIHLWYNSSNILIRNNFLFNQKEPFFYNCKNIWFMNYWNESRSLPKIINGEIKVFEKWIPWFNFDWFPARQPYDI